MSEVQEATPESARRLTDRIKVAVEGTWLLIQEAYLTRTWSALGYTSWDEYCTREFGTSHLRLPREERREVVGSLREAGLSTRAIAAATGVSQPTVRRELDSATESSTQGNDSVGARSVTGVNGKVYNRSARPAPPIPDAEPGLWYGGPGDDPWVADGSSPLPDGPRYCKYCYNEHPLEIGDDGSLIVCSGCNAGLAPLDAAMTAGGYDAFVAEITERFVRENSRPAKPAPVMLTLRTNTGQEIPYPKPQAKPTFNQSDGEGISWAAWSWNPVTGCLHGCNYCYARAIAARFTDAYPAGFTPLFHHERLDAPANTVIPEKHRDDAHRPCGIGDCRICAHRRVFVCSMADLYGRWVPDEWIEQVHTSMLASPDWEYLLLTKFPARYVGLDLPKSGWVGTSVDEQKRVRIAEDAFRQIEGVKVKWLSLEPLREPLEFTDLSMFDWVVIGAQTETRQPDGTVPSFMPPWEWICRITAQAKEAGCKVHWKPNLLNGRPGLALNEYPVT